MYDQAQASSLNRVENGFLTVGVYTQSGASKALLVVAGIETRTRTLAQLQPSNKPHDFPKENSAPVSSWKHRQFKIEFVIESTSFLSSCGLGNI